MRGSVFTARAFGQVARGAVCKRGNVADLAITVSMRLLLAPAWVFGGATAAPTLLVLLLAARLFLTRARDALTFSLQLALRAAALKDHDSKALRAILRRACEPRSRHRCSSMVARRRGQTTCAHVAP